eukprot:m.562548 g.562548  ORF g.562548 m.562548 type:complete len:530 (+) comp22223_c0_seq13:282-1871(+)
MFDPSEGRCASNPAPGSPRRPSQATLSPRRSKLKLVGQPAQSSLTRDGSAGTTPRTTHSPSALSSAFRLLFSAPRRATVTVTVIVLGFILITAARSAHGPDPEKVLSALSEKAYAYNGQVVVDKSALYKALGIKSNRRMGGEDKIALYESLRALSVEPTVESDCRNATLAAHALRSAIVASKQYEHIMGLHNNTGCAACATLDPKSHASSGNLPMVDGRQGVVSQTGAVGANSIADSTLSSANASSAVNIGYQKYAADLLQYGLVAPSASHGTASDAGDAVSGGLRGIVWGLERALPAGATSSANIFPATYKPETGASFFMAGVARAMLLLLEFKGSVNPLQSAFADQVRGTRKFVPTLEAISKWLGSSSSMRGQGGVPDVRFARAAALHMLAPFLSDTAGKDATLAAHRYARKGVELQGEDGTYCYAPSPISDDSHSCAFDLVHHSRALLYATDLYSVCAWNELRAILHESINMALTRLLTSLGDFVPLPSAVEDRRDIHLALLTAGNALDRTDAVQAHRALAKVTQT